ncbi:hypothetical protein D3C81_1196950 [compost metagenome]
MMVQVPMVRKCAAPVEVMLHTDGVLELNVGVRPESTVAVKVGVVPKSCARGLSKVMVCLALGVVMLDEADDGPVPATL